MLTKSVSRNKGTCSLLAFLCFGLYAQSVIAEMDIGGQANILSEKLISIKKGEVLDGSDIEVYINIGDKQGMVPGSRFEIFRRGEALKVDNQIVGYKESKIALVKVERIRENVSNCSILEKKETPKSGDRVYELRAPIKRLVVAQFSYNQTYNQFTKNLQEKLFASFINKGMQVVERDQLEKVLAEQQLGYSGLINIDSARKIGELLGAEAMLLGSVSDLSDSIGLNARLVDLGTGDSLTAAETSMPKTPQIVGLLSNPVEEKQYVMQRNGSKATEPIISSSRKIQKNNTIFKNSFLEISPKSITISKDKKSLSLALLFTNRTEEELFLAVEASKFGGIKSTIMSHNGMIIRPTPNFYNNTSVIGLNSAKNQSQYNNANRYFTSLDTKSQTTIIFTFLSKEKIVGNVFSFSANLLRLKTGEDENGEDIKGKITNFAAGIPNIIIHQKD